MLNAMVLNRGANAARDLASHLSIAGVQLDSAKALLGTADEIGGNVADLPVFSAAHEAVQGAITHLSAAETHDAQRVYGARTNFAHEALELLRPQEQRMAAGAMPDSSILRNASSIVTRLATSMR